MASFNSSWSSPNDEPELLFSFLDQLDSNLDVEVSRNIWPLVEKTKFDPVVGGRESSARSSSSRSSGSTGFFEAVESSPTATTASMSPIVYDGFQKQDFDYDALTQVMTSLSLTTSHPGEPANAAAAYLNNEQALANLAALAQLSSPMVTLPILQPSAMQQSNTTSDHAQMQIRCKFGSLGDYSGQFNSPHGFCMGLNEDIVVADTDNHRIQIFDKNGNFKYAFGTPGKEEGHLWKPRKVAVLKESGNFVICDRGNERSRMQIFSPFGHFIRRIAIRFVDIVAGLAISREGHIVVVDSVTPTIFIINENGTLIRHIECSQFMTEPSDIAVFRDEFYICDFKGHSVVVMHESGAFMRRIDCKPVSHYPNGIDISDAGDILVGDSHGNQFHVAIYDRRGELVFQFLCPQVKVSRCCGLKITSEGYIVTLAKNNNHVLVLNTLYLP